MSARVKAVLFLRHHLAELMETLRYMHLQRCALSLSFSKGAVEKAREDLANAYRAYDEALADCRLHEAVPMHAEPVRVIAPLSEKELYGIEPTGR